MKSFDSRPGRARLTGANALQADVDQPWEQDNQAWWDWYVSLGADEIEEDRRPSQAAVESANALLGRELAGAECASDDELARELERPYRLRRDQSAFFRENGYVKLPDVFSRRTVFRLRAEMLRCFVRSFGLNPDREASDRFLSLELEWLANPVMRQFVLSPRIARLCGQLLGVDAVRLYHDNLLAKQPGCGRTPWHYDHHHFPLATDDVVTAWIPAQSIPTAMGPLAFAGPIDAHQHVADIPFDKFGTTFDQQVEQAFRRLQREIFVEDGPFEIGEVSFHHNLCFHSAGSNYTRYSRMALANTYFVSGARVVENPTMVSGDWQKFMPGTRPGGIADSERNPVCWSRQTQEAQTR
ncbi:MAG: phytanoyl-CoA dioxygenase family protein [Wenzhouxiangellaceae bacterium]